jgi:mannosyl-3-phosphoglycerate phosphatase
VLLVFSDMDGCLLDHHTYEWRPAHPALELLAQLRAPLILTTSKTRAEVEFWQKRIGLQYPSIVENGGAIVLPPGALPRVPQGARQEPDGTVTLPLGWPHERVVEALRQAAEESGGKIRVFSQMSVQDIARHSSLPKEQAALAARREFSEPFLLENPERETDLLRAFLARGLKLTQGSRFYHAQHHESKDRAVARLVELYREMRGPVVTIGLGDGLNDEAFLRLVDHAIILRSAHSEQLSKALPDARVTPLPGPAAWSEALIELITELELDTGPAA